MSELSVSFLRALFEENTEVIPIVLMTIEHDEMGEPGYLALNNEDIISRGNVFMASYFKPELPLDSGNEIPEVSLEIDNVDRRIIDTIRSLETPPKVTLEVITSSDPDTVEMGPFNFDLKSADYDVMKITATLGYEDLLRESFPYGTYNPTEFPGLFS